MTPPPRKRLSDDLAKTHVRVQRSQLIQAAAAASARVPVLIVVHGQEIGRRYLLNEARLLIGRHPRRADLVIEGDLEVSSRHATLILREGRYSVEDLGSLNQTILNGARLESETLLADGDKLLIGATILKFTYQDVLDKDFHVQVEKLINIDELTGLIIKRAFDRKLGWALALAEEEGTSLSVLMMDMDGLKRINDSHGHHVGAGTIAEVGHILAGIMKPLGEVTRFGGDEFTAFVRGAAKEEGLAVGEQIRAAVEAHRFEIAGVVVSPTISIGVAALPDDGDEAAELVRAADAALYRAKAAGRNRVSE
jgi:two-component system, cell cycle response regulator